MYSASQGGKKAQENFNILNADLTEFLDDLEKSTGNSFVICKSADNDNDKLFYKKDKEELLINDQEALEMELNTFGREIIKKIPIITNIKIDLRKMNGCQVGRMQDGIYIAELMNLK